MKKIKRCWSNSFRKWNMSGKGVRAWGGLLNELIYYKSSSAEVFYKIGVLKNFAKFIGYITLVLESLPCNFLQKLFSCRYFPVNSSDFFGVTFCRTTLNDCFWFKVTTFVLYHRWVLCKTNAFQKSSFLLIDL